MEVRALGEGDRGAAFATLVAAFAADPIARWVMPSAKGYLALFLAVRAHMAGPAFAAGGAFATACGA
ncbi:hypothetical protein [Thermaurantiacus sp.]